MKGFILKIKVMHKDIPEEYRTINTYHSLRIHWFGCILNVERSSQTFIAIFPERNISLIEQYLEVYNHFMAVNNGCIMHPPITFEHA